LKAIAIPPGILSPGPGLPPVGGQYESGPGVCYFGGGFCGRNLVFHTFSNAVSTFDAAGQHLTFNTLMNADVVVPGFSGPTVFTGSMSVIIFGRTSNSETGTFNTEMVALSLTDPFGAIVRESPTLASLGSTSITPEGGAFRIGSFFDIFPELSIDGGQNFIPEDGGPNGPVHIELAETPEPASWMLLCAGAGLLGAIRRMRRVGA
jgi:hypothetical protein